MEVTTTKAAARRSTRIRVDIPVSVFSMDRMRPFVDKCMLLIVSANGCGFSSPRPLDVGTPIMFNELPGGGSVTARVANCLPLGSEGKSFLVGASLYRQGNVWGVENPPEDWNAAEKSDPTAAASAEKAAGNTPKLKVQKKTWPYNLFTAGSEMHPGRK